MKYISTRNKSEKVSLSEAIKYGLAKDGGLFVPEEIPKIKDIDSLKNISYSDFAAKILKPYFEGDALEEKLEKICKESFNFDVPFVDLYDFKIMELFHGPTLAFKDFGARFLANCLNETGDKFKIMVATSGDTGGAVASAFNNKKNIDVTILYPNNGISKEQEDQLNCWGENIHSYAIEGSFDDCQDLVKKSFNLNIDNLTSANSINIARLLGQIVYYAYYSLKEKNVNYIIPSGNIGNSMGCFWAKEMGFPIENIYLSSNSNTPIKEFLKNKEIVSLKTIKTVANAMDVGKPSNLERLQNLPNLDNHLKYVKNSSISDELILNTIEQTYKKYGYILDPHTATAVAMFKEKSEKDKNWMIIATAHPSKFKEIYSQTGIKIESHKSLEILKKYVKQKVVKSPNLLEITKSYRKV
tara:strand:- start:13929 stop:15167 length:1239 start_codon:yes stop_codon:yes gene_type:complete